MPGMPRILCLHGMGCNSAVLKWQLAPLIKVLGPYEYVFLEGEKACAPAPGMGNITPPPHLCYHNTVSTLDIAAAHEQVHDFIEEEGPFEGVIGFSQGAALAASLLLHQRLNTGERPIFNFAIFLAGTLPFSPDPGLYREAILTFLGGEAQQHTDEGLDEKSRVDTRSHKLERVEATRNHKDFYASLLGAGPDLESVITSTVGGSENGRAVLATFKADLLSEHSCRPYHIACTDARIGIPTLHVIGRADAFHSQGKDLWRLCDDNERLLVEHTGGHDTPREEQVMKEMARAAQVVIARGNLVAGGVIG